MTCQPHLITLGVLALALAPYRAHLLISKTLLFQMQRPVIGALNPPLKAQGPTQQPLSSGMPGWQVAAGKKLAFEVATIKPANLQEALRDQLGLKLERQRAPIDVLLIDHAPSNPRRTS